MFFSVVIPTYNRAELLRHTLESVFAQEFKDFELIVVNDGSTDNTESVVSDWGDKIRMLHANNSGPGSARNLGINHTEGEYVTFLDSDDLWFPWTLKSYFEVIQKAGAPSFIAGKPFVFDDLAEINRVASADITYDCFEDYFASGDEWRWWGVSSFVIKASALKACGGFVEMNINGEDADLALKLGEARGFVQITSPYTFAYRNHSANVTKDTAKTINGIWHKVNTELAEGYPGGENRAKERRRILTRHVRPVMLDCLKQTKDNEAWNLYWATFRWHVALGRWKFLIGFLIKAMLNR